MKILNYIKKRTSSLKKFIESNKLISLTAMIFFTCLTLNMLLIYNFIRLLENMPEF